MYGRTPYTLGMREVIKLAKAEAGRLGCDWIGPEHYLLGIIRQGEGHAYLALDRLGINMGNLKSCIEGSIGQQHGPNVSLFSPNSEAKVVLDSSKAWATEMGHSSIGPEHLLVGIASSTNRASIVLMSFSAAREQIIPAVLAQIDPPATRTETTPQFPRIESSRKSEKTMRPSESYRAYEDARLAEFSAKRLAIEALQKIADWGSAYMGPFQKCGNQVQATEPFTHKWIGIAECEHGYHAELISELLNRWWEARDCSVGNREPKQTANGLRVGDKYWLQLEVTDIGPNNKNFACHAPMNALAKLPNNVTSRGTEAAIIPDELLQAYDELYTSVKSMFESGKSDPMPSALVIKVRDIKARIGK